MYDNFFYRAKQTVYKWWCVIYKPVYKLTHHGYWPAEKEPYYIPPEEKKQEIQEGNGEDILKNAISESNTDSSSNTVSSDILANESSDTNNEDSEARTKEIMDRLAKEAAAEQAKKQAEIDAARRKADEDARLASILKSTKVDITEFINEGMAHRNDNLNISQGDNSVSATKSADDESIKRANEILDRLNREAAEDEAKKIAEINAAKEFAKSNNL